MSQQVNTNLDYLSVYNKQNIVISSFDNAYPSDTNTNYNISFVSTGQALSTIKKISVSSFTGNNLFYNVASYNNVLDLIVDTTTYYITVPVGYYDATQLASIITSLVLASPAGAVVPLFTCTFSTSTYLFTINSGNPLIPLSIGGLIINPAYVRRYQGTLWWNMGFTSIPSAINNILTAQSIPSLNIQTIYITSVKLGSSKSYRSNGANNSVLANQIISVPLWNVAYGQAANWVSSGTNERGTIIYPQEIALDNIDIQLRNEYGNILECPLNCINNIEFLIYF